MSDKLVEICTLFFMMAVVAYVMIAYRQFSYLQPATYRLTVLSTRAALLLPLCALFIYISAIFPSSYVMMMVIITAIEGYCLYAFLALITVNLGGPSAVVELITKSQRALLCHFCLPNDPTQFYRLTVWAAFLLIAARTAISAIAAISFYADTKSGKQAYVVYNFISALVLVFGMVCLVNLYENVYEHCINLFGVLKLALLKILVAAIVLQGLIENVLYSDGSVTYTDDGTYTAEQKSMRAYCALVLLEFALLSVVFYYAFGDHRITPSSAPPAVREFLTNRRSPHRVSTAGVRGVETLVYSFREFMRDVFAVRDILQVGYFHVEDTETSLSEPLNGVVQGGDSEDYSAESGGDGRSGSGSGSGARRGFMGSIASYASPASKAQQQRAPWSTQSRAGAPFNQKGGAEYSSLPRSGDWDEEFSLPEEAAAGRGAGGVHVQAAGSGAQAAEPAAPLSPMLNMGTIYGSPSSRGGGGAFASPVSSQLHQAQSQGVNSPFVDYAQVYGDGDDDVGEHESV